MQKKLRQVAVAALTEMQPYVKRVFGFNYSLDTTQLIVRTTGKCSYGGLVTYNAYHKVPYLNLCFVDLLSYKDDAVASFHEYDELAHDSEIGDMDCDYATWVYAIVAHELAHAIDHAGCYTVPAHARKRVLGSNDPLATTHGVRWQHIYRLLRRRFVNNRQCKHAALSAEIV